MEVCYKYRPRDLLQIYIYRFNSSVEGKIGFVVWLLIPFLIYTFDWFRGINAFTSPDLGQLLGWLIGSISPFLFPLLRPSLVVVFIDPQGFTATVKSLSNESTWREVKSVEEDGYYIYFRKAWRALAIPKDAFASSREVEMYFHKALFCWREANGIPSPPVPDVSGVWPPAPRHTDSQELGGNGKR